MPTHGTTWLHELGYRTAYRHNGWVDCLIWRDTERWLGTGEDEAQAYADALAKILPSEAARRAFAIAIAPNADATNADAAAAGPGRPLTATAGSVPTEGTEPVQIAPLGQEPVEPTWTLPLAAGPATPIEEPQPIQPVDEPIHATRSSDSPAVQPNDSVGPATSPTTAGQPHLPTDPAAMVFVPPRPPRLGLREAHRALDALQIVVDANYEEASLLAPDRQRLLLTQWMARARAIDDAAQASQIERRVYALAQDLGKLAKVWWPGSILTLARTSSAIECSRDYALGLPRYAQTWEELEIAAAEELEAREENAAEHGLDDMGWRDGNSLPPPPRDPLQMLKEVVRTLESVSTPPLIPPRAAPHTALLIPDYKPQVTAQATVKWSTVAARLRWLRGCSPDLEIWGAAMGRLRWLAAKDTEIHDEAAEIFDPSFQPPGTWQQFLGVDKTEQLAAIAPILATAPRGPSTDDEVVAWLSIAFDVGLALPTNRIALALAGIADRIRSLSVTMFPERRHRRRLRDLQQHLSNRVDPSPEATALQDSSPEHQAESGDATPTVSREDHMANSLRLRTSGKRVLFVSNRLDTERDQKLCNMLGFRSIETCLPDPARVHGKEHGIRMGAYDLVLAATGFLPHKVDGVLKEACKFAEVPYVRVNRGRILQCLLHLTRELGLQRKAASPAMRAR